MTYWKELRREEARGFVGQRIVMHLHCYHMAIYGSSFLYTYGGGAGKVRVLHPRDVNIIYEELAYEENNTR